MKTAKLRDQKNNLHIALYEMLRLWCVDNDKKGMLKHYKTLTPFEQECMLGALKDVISTSDNEEFRQAGKDIPEYIKANSEK